MAVPNHYMKRRDVLRDPSASPERLSALGREMLDKQRLNEALDFFERAKDRASIASIKQQALDEGNTFLLARLERFDRTLVEAEDWEHAGTVAAQKGRPSMQVFAKKKIAELTGESEGSALPGVGPLEERLAE